MDKLSNNLLSGAESFTISNQPAGFSVIDFWRFQFSNIWDIQDQVAEFIVARALGQDMPHNKNGWTLWDINYCGKRIEVKETAYYHSWRVAGSVSAQRVFGIGKAYSRYKDTSSDFQRQNDVYVFCLNTGETREESNPLVLNHWRFWVIPTETINRVCGNYKSITLRRLQKLTGLKNGISYNELRASVDECCK